MQTELIIVYLLDAQGQHVDTQTIDPMGRMPEHFTLEVPPALAGGQYAQWNGSAWLVLEKLPEVPKSIEIPHQVTMRQARLALLEQGLLSQVAPAIATLDSPNRERAEIEWEFSSEVYRDRPLVAMLGPKLGMTAAQLDQLFIIAAGL